LNPKRETLKGGGGKAIMYLPWAVGCEFGVRNRRLAEGGSKVVTVHLVLLATESEQLGRDGVEVAQNEASPALQQPAHHTPRTQQRLQIHEIVQNTHLQQHLV